MARWMMPSAGLIGRSGTACEKYSARSPVLKALRWSQEIKQKQMLLFPGSLEVHVFRLDSFWRNSPSDFLIESFPVLTS